MPTIGERIAELDVPVPVKKALVAGTAAALGVATGGGAGATTAFNETSNNYLTAADLRSRQQKLQACAGDGACEVRVLQTYELKSANNTGGRGTTVLDKVYFERSRDELEQLLLDPSASEETKAQARQSINELNVAINVIDKAPVLRDAAELGLLTVDVITLGEFAAARALTSTVVKQMVLQRTGKKIGDVAAARLANSFYRDGAELPQALATSQGTVIQATPGRTTTVLGGFVDDTNSIINQQLGLPKSTGYLDAKPGGFNLLNTPDEIYLQLGPNEFWRQVNKPFLDAAVDRGDIIKIATEPSNLTLFRNDSRSGFGREIEYLESLGYRYDSTTQSMIKRK